jgi:hypothetical protein
MPEPEPLKIVLKKEDKKDLVDALEKQTQPGLRKQIEAPARLALAEDVQASLIDLLGE